MITLRTSDQLIHPEPLNENADSSYKLFQPGYSCFTQEREAYQYVNTS